MNANTQSAYYCTAVAWIRRTRWRHRVERVRRDAVLPGSLLDCWTSQTRAASSSYWVPDSCTAESPERNEHCEFVISNKFCRLQKTEWKAWKWGKPSWTSNDVSITMPNPADRLQWEQHHDPVTVLCPYRPNNVFLLSLTILLRTSGASNVSNKITEFSKMSLKQKNIESALVNWQSLFDAT